LIDATSFLLLGIEIATLQKKERGYFYMLFYRNVNSSVLVPSSSIRTRGSVESATLFGILNAITPEIVTSGFMVSSWRSDDTTSRFVAEYSYSP
jgi:hypothetical protein